MSDFTHLDALNIRLSNERGYLAAAKSNREARLRSVWISQIEAEIAGEIKLLNILVEHCRPMTDDELLAELME